MCKGENWSIARPMTPNGRLRQALKAGAPALGVFVKFNTPAIIEILGLGGFDFVILDQEHGGLSHADIESLVRAAQGAGISSIVRVPDASETQIVHALDSGASGVQVPSLKSALQLRDAVSRARFHPLGQRGFARSARAGRYGQVPLEDFFADAAETLFVAHVENQEMITEIDDACATPGLDVLFIGAGDLSQSMGYPGQTTHPEVRAAAAHVTERARAGGKHVGAIASSTADIRTLISQGVTYIVWPSDVAMLLGAAKGAVETFKAAL